ncbi:hypothetical protein Q8F55_005725 [Vanrija albida]|uniref:ZW10 C-terminal helical domain-containing protein n=1 Tax=Vanrija albida TaxID=181172 RepID=A0ABR3Q2G3_9TREE
MGAVILPSGSPGAEDAASGPAVALSTVVTAGGRPTSASLATHAQELQEKAHAEEGALHSLVRTHRNSIADQVTSGQALATASVSIDDSLQSVERQFDILDASHATSLTPLIDAAVSRQTYLHEAAVANLTASTLASIKKQYDGLVDLEDAMWTGHGADEAFLAQLEHAQSPNVGGIDTAVASAIRSRHDLLRTMASEQLSNAWAGAISVTEGISTSGPRIQVTKEVHLSAPRRWAHWAWKVVDVEVVDDAKAVDNLNAVNVKDTISPSIPTEEGDLSEPEDGDGWGFDADDDQPATKGTATLAQNDAEENDGWGFDDESPTVPQPVVPKKPVKEARRLGKKVGSKPTPPSEERLDHVEQYGAAQPSPRAPSPPSNAVKTVVTVGSTASKPTYRISTICDEVLAMAGDLANDIDGFSKLQFTHSSFASSGSRLEGQLAEVLDFIRATTPVAHAAHLKSTPAATLQLGNDFTYIGNGLHESQGVTALPTVSDVSERFKAAGRTLFLACAEDQIAHVSALLKVVNRLVDTADETVFANAQVAIQQLVEFVENLAKQTESVVEAPRYFQFLGLVIEEVCNTFLDDVLAMDDITEVESTRIGLLLGRIESLEQLFKSNTDDVSSIPTFVPHWLKLCYVNELLGANLVDITYLFENGSLVDFTPDELAKLIRALFADSEKRTKLLGKVEFSA